MRRSPLLSISLLFVIASSFCSRQSFADESNAQSAAQKIDLSKVPMEQVHLDRLPNDPDFTANLEPIKVHKSYMVLAHLFFWQGLVACPLGFALGQLAQGEWMGLESEKKDSDLYRSPGYITGYFGIAFMITGIGFGAAWRHEVNEKKRRETPKPVSVSLSATGLSISF